MKELELVKLEASEGMYLSNGELVSKVIVCLKEVKNTFYEISQEEGDRLLKERRESEIEEFPQEDDSQIETDF